MRSEVAVSGPVRLADLTTIRLGGPAPSVTTVESAAEVADVLGTADRAGGALVLGGGSNVVVADAGVHVPVVRMGIRGVRIEKVGYDGALGRGPAVGAEAIAVIGAGEDWDPVVAELVDAGWAGAETLSGIPGSAGATPVQNVGAYGTEIADVLVDVEIYDRRAGRLRTAQPGDLRLGYRSSALRGRDAAVVTSVRIALTRSPAPIRYPELARLLDVEVGEAAPPADVRAAVLELRRAKGMVLDAADADTRSVGSFFTNPVVGETTLATVLERARERLGAEARVPQYPAGAARPGDGRLTKLSAAWLIERSGFPKGYPLVPGAGRPVRLGSRVAVSTKHTLALTNRGGATTAELVDLAREIRTGVQQVFGLTLQPEPMLIGVGLDPPG